MTSEAWPTRQIQDEFRALRIGVIDPAPRSAEDDGLGLRLGLGALIVACALPVYSAIGWLAGLSFPAAGMLGASIAAINGLVWWQGTKVRPRCRPERGHGDVQTDHVAVFDAAVSDERCLHVVCVDGKLCRVVESLKL